MDRVFSFLLWPKCKACGPWKQRRKKRGSMTCHTDRADEANKMFIIWLCWLFWFWKNDRELEVRTATYGPGIDQSQHAKSVSHIIEPIIALNPSIYYWTEPFNLLLGWTLQSVIGRNPSICYWAEPLNLLLDWILQSTIAMNPSIYNWTEPFN